MFKELAHLVEAGTHESVTLTVSKAGTKGEVRVAFFPQLAEKKETGLTDDEKNALTSNLILEGTPADLDEVAWGLITEQSSVLADAKTQIDEAKEKVKKATTPAKKAPAKKAEPRKTKAQLKEEARAKQAAEAPTEEFKDERSKVDNKEKEELDKAADAVQATVPSDPDDPQDEMDDLLAGL
jgi:PRTRC genetic system protein E